MVWVCVRRRRRRRIHCSMTLYTSTEAAGNGGCELKRRLECRILLCRNLYSSTTTSSSSYCLRLAFFPTYLYTQSNTKLAALRFILLEGICGWKTQAQNDKTCSSIQSSSFPIYALLLKLPMADGRLIFNCEQTL